MVAFQDIQNAWLLHSRPFRETSLLLEFLTEHHGRVSAVARGYRGARSRGRPALQPFVPLLVSFSGKHELKSLKSCEFAAASRPLSGTRLFAGFYLNELLVKLLHAHEAEHRLFSVYTEAVGALGAGRAVEPVLREFELALLDSLGYGLQLGHDADSGEEIHETASYYLKVESGFVRQMQPVPGLDDSNLYPGSALRKISAGDYAEENTRMLAKRMLRQVLQYHLGGRQLGSRQLFRKSGADLEP